MSGTAWILRVPRPSRVTATFAGPRRRTRDRHGRGRGRARAVRNLARWSAAQPSPRAPKPQRGGGDAVGPPRPQVLSTAMAGRDRAVRTLDPRPSRSARRTGGPAGAHSVGCDVRPPGRRRLRIVRVRRRRELFVELPAASRPAAVDRHGGGDTRTAASEHGRIRSHGRTPSRLRVADGTPRS